MKKHVFAPRSVKRMGIDFHVVLQISDLKRQTLQEIIEIVRSFHCEKKHRFHLSNHIRIDLYYLFVCLFI